MEHIVLPVVYTALQLFLFIGIGVVIKKAGSWSEDFFTSLSRLVVRVVIPVYLFSRISRTDIGDFSSSWIFFAASALVTVTGFSLGALFFSGKGIGRRERKAGISFSAFGNSGYLAISITDIIPISFPLLAEAVGSTTPFLYIGAYNLIHSVCLWSVGNFLIAGTSKRIRGREFFSPPVVGILSGFLVMSLGIGPLLEDKALPLYHLYTVLDKMSGLALPLVLICLGAMIAGLKPGMGRMLKAGRFISRILVIRFLLFPGLFYLFYFILFKPQEYATAQLWILFLMTHTPPALNLSVMAAQGGVNKELTSYTFLITYSVYIVLLPLFLLIFFGLPGLF